MMSSVRSRQTDPLHHSHLCRLFQTMDGFCPVVGGVLPPEAARRRGPVPGGPLTANLHLHTADQVRQCACCALFSFISFVTCPISPSLCLSVLGLCGRFLVTRCMTGVTQHSMTPCNIALSIPTASSFQFAVTQNSVCVCVVRRYTYLATSI